MNARGVGSIHIEQNFGIESGNVEFNGRAYVCISSIHIIHVLSKSMKIKIKNMQKKKNDDRRRTRR